MMLSNFDLENLAKYYKLHINDVCMKDELPNTVQDGCYIINMQSSSKGTGTHWIALFIIRENAYYFDSFGAVPPIEICEFVNKRKHSHLYYNNWIIQDLQSSDCGFFSLAFLLWMTEHLQRNMFNVYNDFVNSFSSDTSINDEILKSFFKSSTSLHKPYILQRFTK